MAETLEFFWLLFQGLLAALVISVAVAAPIACIDSQLPDATTIQHDGHRYIRFKNREAVIHDPDCPCHHTEGEAAQ